MKNIKTVPILFLAGRSDLTYIDLLEPLQALKAKGSHQLYLKTDHHWTDYSGMQAAPVILDRLREDFPVPYQQERLVGHNCDLKPLFALDRYVPDVHPVAVGRRRWQLGGPTLKSRHYA